MAKKEESTFPISKKWIAVGIIALIFIILIATVWGSYNSLVKLDQNVNNAWANVQAQYQRRFDLIPNLVEVTQKYAKFEKDTLTQITQLRSQWQTNTPTQLADSDNQFQNALSRLLLISENYPELKADSVFIGLQDNLVETENMVSTSRTRYNDAVRGYNTATKVFPSNVIAGWFGFSEKSYFEAASGSQDVPKVDINLP